MSYFRRIERADLLSRVAKRAGEVKLGEKLRLGFEGEHYVIIGVPESIGVKANFGRSGTESLWEAFLDVFVNIQSTRKFTGEEASVLGYFDFSAIEPKMEASIEERRDAVRYIDEAVFEEVKKAVLRGKVPVVIGGGHNNSYPIIKGVAKGLYESRGVTVPSINAVNMDAHADFRQPEGRHSGNGFRYAYLEKYLEKYAVLGLSENYNSQPMLEDMASNPDISLIFWEDIFLRRILSFEDALWKVERFVGDQPFGVELDLDSVENVLSSAMSPTGFSASQARQYVYRMGLNKNAAYLHVCEGAVKMSDKEDIATSKLVSYLVSDFIKGNLEVLVAK